MSRVRGWAVAGVLLSGVLVIAGCDLFNRPPEASFEVHYNVEETDPLVVELDASASSDPDGDPLTYQWSFGSDEGVDVVPQVYSGTYEVPVLWVDFRFEDVYEVTLVVRDDHGNASAPIQDTVLVPSLSVEPTE